MDAAIFGQTRLERPHHGGADRDHAAAEAARQLDPGRGRNRDVEALRMRVLAALEG
jgi:hypothetical protein